MRNLRVTDGSARHLDVLREHRRRCRAKRAEALFLALYDEGGRLDSSLCLKLREIEDEEEESANVVADLDASEVALEDSLRDVSDALSPFDRQLPERDIYAKVFPQGLSAVISPERQRQVAPAQQVLVRLAQFADLPGVPALQEKTAQALSTFEAALRAKENSDQRLKTLQGEELQLRAQVREQLTSAHSRLTDLYKANPALAERFFHPNPRYSSGALSRAEERGRVAGKIEALQQVFASRGVVLSDEQQKKVLAATEPATLERWLERALEGAPLSDIFVAPALVA
jgi:hypothetical protein